MKISDILNESHPANDQATDHILDFLEDFLTSHNFKVKVARAIEGLEDDQMEKLKGMLFKSAKDNYDYATDSGPSVYVPEKDVIAALQQMKVL